MKSVAAVVDLIIGKILSLANSIKAGIEHNFQENCDYVNQYFQLGILCHLRFEKMV